jgi:hypothetical protein
MFGSGLVIGSLLTTLFWVLFAWWFIEKEDGGKVLLDRWWMENPERWEWVRQHELSEAGEKSQ